MKATRWWVFLLPLVFFGVLAVFLGKGLSLNPREVPSPFIGKAAPAFALPRLDNTAQLMRRDDLLGRVWVLNVWASWCVPCREEHPLLMQLAQLPPAQQVHLVGLNYKDKPEAATKFLAQLGNPYATTLVDADGRVGIDYGVYGVPETFVIDAMGIVRFKHVGALNGEVVAGKLLPLLKQLQQQQPPPAAATSPALLTPPAGTSRPTPLTQPQVLANAPKA